MIRVAPTHLSVVEPLIAKRDGETRLGENIHFYKRGEDLSELPGKFCLIGIEEDIGPRANYGRGGTRQAWNAGLERFVNIQSNQFLDGEDIIVLGAIECADLLAKSDNLIASKQEDREAMFDLVEELDERVLQVAHWIVNAGKIPIVIGGGHNNAYPLLAGSALAIQQGDNSYILDGINCINLDPHADLRAPEGRHSGNGFSYAMRKGFIHRYAVIGLHESYNNRYIFDQFGRSMNLFFNTFDSYVRGEKDMDTLLAEGLGHVSDGPVGIELDLDAVQDVPTSAMSPSGISVNQARRYVSLGAQLEHPVYLHICEGAPTIAENGYERVGKIIAYLVSDFIKSYRQRI